MSLPSHEFAGLWGMELAQGQPVRHHTDFFHVQVTNATLVDSVAKAKAKVGADGCTVFVSYANKLVPATGPHAKTDAHVIASLLPQHVEQVQLNLVLVAGEEVVFHAVGTRVIHLTGNLFKVVPPPKGSPAGQPEAVVTGQWRPDVSGAKKRRRLASLTASMDKDTARSVVGTETSPKKTSSAVKHALDPSPPKKKQLINLEHVPKDLKAPPKKTVFTPTTATPTTAAATSTKPARFAKKKERVDRDKLLFDTPQVDGASTDSQRENASRDELPSDVATEDLDEVMVEDHAEGNGVRMAQIGDTVHILWRLCTLDGTTIRDETAERTALTLGEAYISEAVDRGLINASVGTEREIVIPPAFLGGLDGEPGVPEDTVVAFQCIVKEVIRKS